MIKLAVLGGSITYGANASDPERNSWPPLVAGELEKCFEEEVTLINAGIGGTGSGLGVFRLDQDVLSFRPDIVTVEFSVNDGDGDRDRVGPPFESILRKIWDNDPRTRIVIIIAARRGGEQSAPQVHRDIADYYNVPVVDVSRDWRRRVDAGEWRWDDLLIDGVHPNDRGFSAYARLVMEVLRGSPDDQGLAPVTMPPPLFEDLFIGARMVEPRTVAPEWDFRPSPWDEWVGVRAVGGPGPKDFPDTFRHGMVVGETGDRFVWEALGRVFGLFYRITERSAPVAIKVDGEEREKITHSIQSCTRPSYELLGREKGRGRHRIEVEVLPMDDGSRGEFCLGYGLLA